MSVRVGLLFGGESAEHEVSLQSAAAILRAMRPPLLPLPIGITRRGEWYYFDGGADAIGDSSWERDASRLSPVSLSLSSSCFRTPDGILPVDVIFPALHGTGCEDGLQGLLDASHLPYVGCGALCGAVCMDKATAKAVVAARAPDVRQARSLVFGREIPDGAAETVAAKIGFPAFCKPSRGGSSVGASPVRDAGGLLPALTRATEHGDALCEEYLRGTETEVALLETPEGLLVSRPGCVRHPGAFYDYETKYHAPGVTLEIPGRLPPAAAERCRADARRLFRLLGCRQLARADFFVTDHGDVIFNEINTMPGFTPGSMYPRLMEDAGFPLPALVSALVTGALR